MSENESERCLTCRFYDEIDEAGGMCRRYPPVKFRIKAVKVELPEDWRFPSVWSNDWCGEWRAKRTEGE